MKLKRLLICTLLLSSNFICLGQKVKYKDIFPLIEKNDYDAAIPMINSFLKDSKNDEHANANLQLGLYHEQKNNDLHVLSDSTELLEFCDSAIYFLNLAKTLITDKELKKNSDYYQSFYRRDLRTGEFGIKLSDVQLDLDNKIESLKKLNKYSRIIYKNLKIGDRNYSTSNEQYRHLSTLYGSENDFALMSSELEQDELKTMVTRSDSITNAVAQVRDAVSKLGKKGYSPEIKFNEIKQYGVDGKIKGDFYENDIEVWDYAIWSQNLQSKLRLDVNKMRDNLNDTYGKLKSNYDKSKIGGGITENDLILDINPELKNQLRSLDEEPIPEKLLELLISEIKFEFITNKKLNLRLADESDVNYQLAISDSINTIISNISNKVADIVEPYTTTGTKKYPKFIKDNYGGEIGLIKYKQSVETKYAKEMNKWKELSAYWMEKSKWGVSEDLADSI
jgi:hypothetical protein